MLVQIKPIMKKDKPRDTVTIIFFQKYTKKGKNRDNVSNFHQAKIERG